VTVMDQDHHPVIERFPPTQDFSTHRKKLSDTK